MEYGKILKNRIREYGKQHNIIIYKTYKIQTKNKNINILQNRKILIIHL